MFRSKKEEAKEKVTFHNVEEIEKEINRSDLHQLPTSTTLTPHEVYLMRQMGYKPMQVVFGNVVFSMGALGFLRTIFRAFTRGEMVDFSRLNRDARLLARNRMLEMAKDLGAESVWGVKFDIREYADFIEVIATGTALQKDDRPITPASVPVSVGV